MIKKVITDEDSYHMKSVLDLGSHDIIVYYNMDKTEYSILSNYTNHFGDQVYSWFEISKYLQIVDSYVNVDFYDSINESILAVKNKGSQIWCIDSIFDIIDLISIHKKKD